MFSIAATWVILGVPGLIQYEFVRQSASTARLRDNKNTLPLSNAEPYEHDSFHDGKRVLQEVTDWHRHLSDVARASDTVTKKVLQLVDAKMLCQYPEARIEVKKLCEELGQIISDARTQPQVKPPTSLHHIFEQMEYQAAKAAEAASSSRHSQPSSSQLTLPGAEQDRKSRKSRNLDIPLKPTTHRSVALKSQKNPSFLDSAPLLFENTLSLSSTLPSDSLAGPSRPLTATESEQGMTPPDDPEAPPKWRDNMGRFVNQNRASTYDTQLASSPRKISRRPKTLMSEPSLKQDVWQARAAIDRQPRNLKSFLKGGKKDELLERHFGDRDIVRHLARYDLYTIH